MNPLGIVKAVRRLLRLDKYVLILLEQKKVLVAKISKRLLS